MMASFLLKRIRLTPTKVKMAFAKTFIDSCLNSPLILLTRLLSWSLI